MFGFLHVERSPRSSVSPDKIQPGPSPPLSLAHGHTIDRAPRPFCLAFYPDVLTEPRGTKRLFPTRPQATRVIVSLTTKSNRLLWYESVERFETSRSVWLRPSGALAATSGVRYSTRRHVSVLCNRPPADPPRSTPISRGQNAKGRPNCKTIPGQVRHPQDRHLEQQLEQSHFVICRYLESFRLTIFVEH